MKKLGLLLLSISVFASMGLHNARINEAAETYAATETANMGQLYDFLSTKEEHYEYSDAYIKEYQQASGGYIDLWKSLGGVVDKENCVPNQKWHYFESWCKPSIDDGSFKFSAAGSRGYSNFSCPELQLWIIEASGIPSSKVKEAYDAAVEEKIAGSRVSTICAAIRAIVPWSDINDKVLENLPANPNYHVSPSVDSATKTPSYTMSKFNYDGYQPGEKVEFTLTVNDSTKEIDSISGTNVTITENDGVYSFTMPFNHVDLNVILKEKGEEEPPTINDGYKLVTNLDELIDGAKVIIGTHYTFRRNAAISTTQNQNNRSSISMIYTDGYYSVDSAQSSDVSLCVFTISSVEYEGKKYYQFFDSNPTNKGYLYVASNSNNYLRTQETNNVNGYFEITNNNGLMTIVASASKYSRNTIGNYSSTFIACGGATSKTTTDMAIYCDVVDTDRTWANSYLKMNDNSFNGEGSGLCKTKGLYSDAKAALVGMGYTYIEVLKTSNDIDLNAACNRYEAWAIANGDDNPYNGLINYNSPLFNKINFYNNNNNNLITVIIVAFLSSISLLAFLLLQKNKI